MIVLTCDGRWPLTVYDDDGNPRLGPGIIAMAVVLALVAVILYGAVMTL